MSNYTPKYGYIGPRDSSQSLNVNSLEECVNWVLDEVHSNFSRGIDITFLNIEGKESILSLEKISTEDSIQGRVKLDQEGDPRLFIHFPKNCFLGTEDKEEFERTLVVLKKTSHLLETLGIKGRSIVLRVGPSYGNKKQTLQRLVSRFNKLPKDIKDRIILTNDDRPSLFSITDLLSHVHYETGIPLCFRFLPHQFNNGKLSAKEAFALSLTTWEEGEIPIFIHSESSEIDENGVHVNREPADFIKHRIPTFNLFADIVIDAKKKDGALIRYISEKPALPPMVINKITK
jgi:UV DNA damage repair endonuclease